MKGKKLKLKTNLCICESKEALLDFFGDLNGESGALNLAEAKSAFMKLIFVHFSLFKIFHFSNFKLQKRKQNKLINAVSSN